MFEDQNCLKTPKAQQFLVGLFGMIVSAATYSSAYEGSTIGAAGLNGSVRDGERWAPALGRRCFVRRGWVDELSLAYSSP